MMWSDYQLFVLLGRGWHNMGVFNDAERALEEQQIFEYVMGLPAKIIGHHYARPNR